MTVNLYLIGVSFAISFAYKFACCVKEGQYLQFSFLLQGPVSARGDLLSSFWLVEARTNWSERFLFHRRPNMILEYNKGLVVLVFPRISQFLVIVSLIGGFLGL